ncbi:shikimate dehydrogenase [Conyzicola lurida]|uniref:shikimate dehydrogenase n=1 Tax=Conyzicola lurida TaxID=1172621 RepID=UPI00161568B0
MTPVARLAVLGSPIAHSRSPHLHAAAYRELGLDWEYGAVDVTGDRLAEFIGSRGPQWRGLSLTMPLKRDVLPLLDTVDETAELTGAANTLLFDRSSGELALRGFNTDVYGVTEAFREAGVDRLGHVQIVGGGATAASVLVAVKRLGAERVLVSVRDTSRVGALVSLAAALDVELTVRELGVQDRSLVVPDAIISTIPGHGVHDLVFAGPVREGAVLFDVAYDPWPSAFATAWLEVGGRVISGLEMLLHQALAQVRVFVSGSPEVAVDREARVLAAMRASIAH